MTTIRLVRLTDTAQISQRTAPMFKRYMFSGSTPIAVATAPATVKAVADHSKIASLFIMPTAYLKKSQKSTGA